MFNGSGRSQIQGELGVLAFGGTGCNLGDGLAANNHIIIDCGWRNLVFPEHEGLELISA